MQDLPFKTLTPEQTAYTIYYTYFFQSVKCSNIFDDFFLPVEYNRKYSNKHIGGIDR